MQHKLFRVFREHWWAVAVVHPVIVTVLLTVFLSIPPIHEFATSLSRLSPDEQVGIYVFALALIVALYVTLLLDLTLRQQHEDGRWPLASSTLIGLWEPVFDHPSHTGTLQKIVVVPSDEGVSAQIITATDRREIIESLDITELLTGEAFVLRARTTLEPPQLWQLELVLPADQEAYLILRRGLEAQTSDSERAMPLLLRKSRRARR